MRNLLRVNMTDLSVTAEPVPEAWAKYGGRALTDAIVYHEVPADTDPLGPGNKLVFAPGTLGGTTAPNGGRLSVGARARSPAASRNRTPAARPPTRSRVWVSRRSWSRAFLPTRTPATCS